MRFGRVSTSALAMASPWIASGADALALITRS
jgi:hypothetical protein